jgi:hypothetical protein
MARWTPLSEKDMFPSYDHDGVVGPGVSETDASVGFEQPAMMNAHRQLMIRILIFSPRALTDHALPAPLTASLNSARRQVQLLVGPLDSGHPSVSLTRVR